MSRLDVGGTEEGMGDTSVKTLPTEITGDERPFIQEEAINWVHPLIGFKIIPCGNFLLVSRR